VYDPPVRASRLAAPTAVVGTALPAHVYAPYFETWTADGITPIAQ
jgi:hypothetical protein